MTRPGSLAALGPVIQTAYVADDPAPLLRHWTETIGAGPFFAIQNLGLGDSRVRGRPSAITIDAYVGAWGDMIVEIIRPHSRAPSVYTEWLEAGRSGVHHFAVMVADLDEARRAMAAAGLAIAQESVAYNGDPFFYVDTGREYLEVLLAEEGLAQFFDMVRAAHRAWDGCDPVRPAPSDEIERGGNVIEGDA